jgi:hypothetical protein
MADAAERNAAVDALKNSGALPIGVTNAQLLKLADAVLAVAEAKPQINPGTIIGLLIQHGDQIQQIITKLGGLGNIMAILPNLLSLWDTALSAAQTAAAQGDSPAQAILDVQEGGRQLARQANLVRRK